MNIYMCKSLEVINLLDKRINFWLEGFFKVDVSNNFFVVIMFVFFYIILMLFFNWWLWKKCDWVVFWLNMKLGVECI